MGGRATHNRPPVVRAASPGSIIESAIPANTPANGARGLDRLQPEMPSVAKHPPLDLLVRPQN
jgi:hypothetical protein